MEHYEYSNIDTDYSSHIKRSSKTIYLVIVLGITGLAVFLTGIIYLFAKKAIKSNTIPTFSDIFPERTIFDGLFVSLADEHSNELIRPQDNYIEYFSGFTGSLAYVFITKEKKYIMVDSRYYIQVKNEVKDFEILHYNKEGIEKIKTIFTEMNFAYISQITSVNLYTSFNKLFKTFEPIDEFENIAKWNKYVQEQTKVFEHKFAARLNFNYLKEGILSEDVIKQGKVESYKQLKNYVLNAGALTSVDSTAEKIKRIKTELENSTPDYFVLSSLSQIAWLLNVRGFDMLYTPLIDSYLVLEFARDQVVIRWYLDKEKIDYIAKTNLILPVIKMFEKSKFFEYLASIKNKKIFIDPDTLNMKSFKVASASNELIYDKHIIEKLKAVKSEEELKRSVVAASYDSLAFFRIWMYFEELDLKKESIDEFKLSMEIENIRSTTPYYLMPSYESIVGAGENGAIVHYEPNEKITKEIKETDVLLIDSGGQYHGYGTTDVTRVLVKSVKSLDALVQDDYTYVLKAQISVLRQEFDAKEFQGEILDKIVRDEMLKGDNREFGHGTSHGIGMESDVHEGPYSIGYPGEIPNNVIMSDEPGFYREGKWGIRLENDVVSYMSKEGKRGLKILTLICYEEKLMNKKLLTDDGKKFINEYHANVITTLSNMKDIEDNLLNFIKHKCVNIE